MIQAMQDIKPVARFITLFAVLGVLYTPLSSSNVDATENLHAFLISELRTTTATLSKQSGKNWAVLVTIGDAQLRLEDERGALATLRFIATIDQPAIRDLANAIAFRQASSGHVDKALETVTLISSRPLRSGHCKSLTMVALGALKSNNRAAAQLAIDKAKKAADLIEDPFDKASALIGIAKAQVTIGPQREASRAFEVAKTLGTKFPESGDLRVHYCCLMAELANEMTEKKVMETFMGDATKALAVGTIGGPERAQLVMLTQARCGDITGALRTAESMPAFGWNARHRDEALGVVAAIQVRRGDRIGAQKTANLIREFIQYRDTALAMVVKSYLIAEGPRKAIEISEGIKEESVRAVTMLRIATYLAQHGQKDAARQIGDRIAYPRTKDVLRVQNGAPAHYRFGEPSTWAEPYAALHTQASINRALQLAGDLTAASVACHVALEGRGVVLQGDMLTDWDTRKAAAAQTEAGDVNGVLEWMKGLTGVKRLDALLGIVDGGGGRREGNE
jgi:hypothetical protein